MIFRCKYLQSLGGRVDALPVDFEQGPLVAGGAVGVGGEMVDVGAQPCGGWGVAIDDAAVRAVAVVVAYPDYTQILAAVFDCDAELTCQSHNAEREVEPSEARNERALGRGDECHQQQGTVHAHRGQRARTRMHGERHQGGQQTAKAER